MQIMFFLFLYQGARCRCAEGCEEVWGQDQIIYESSIYCYGYMWSWIQKDCHPFCCLQWYQTQGCKEQNYYTGLEVPEFTWPLKQMYSSHGLSEEALVWWRHYHWLIWFPSWRNIYRQEGRFIPGYGPCSSWWKYWAYINNGEEEGRSILGFIEGSLNSILQVCNICANN